ncbi:MAG: (d)CMP kinase [Bacillota bacterium]
MFYKVIAIDGPAGAGKSTVAKRIARELDYTYIDSGAMYRALTYKVLQCNINPEDRESVTRLADVTDIEFKDNCIFLDNVNVSVQIRDEAVSNIVSQIASIKEVRRIMVCKQRKLSENKNIVMDGRDVGTVIFPNAYKKFFLTANIEERAKRRYEEIVKKGHKANMEEIKLQISKRDHLDTSREDSPLKAAEDAIYIDTTGKSIDEVVNEIIKEIH